MSGPVTYRKRPVEIQAMQWLGDNTHEIWEWITAANFYGPLPIGDPLDPAGRPARLWVRANMAWLDLEVGEWIIQDENGFYPCKAETFARTYEAVES